MLDTDRTVQKVSDVLQVLLSLNYGPQNNSFKYYIIPIGYTYTACCVHEYWNL